MLNSLEIKNYRILKDLKINALSRVNLITGKNNTGKSSILEAIAIYASKGDLNTISDILEERGELIHNTKIIDNNFNSLSSIFNEREIAFNTTNSIKIGEIGSDFQEINHQNNNLILLSFVKFINENKIDKDGNLIAQKRTSINIPNENFIDNLENGFKIITDQFARIYSIESIDFFKPSLNSNKLFQYVKTTNYNKELNAKLFDNVSLTEKEKYVVDALKIIDKHTERIAFSEDGNKHRSAKIKLNNKEKPLPIQSMGDGINRILNIILSLVNCENGYLLIDEFENGLHYSVQEKLWEIIFSLSEKLNIQVFATTHSEDCIRGFESVLNNSTQDYSGKLIRLDNKNGVIKNVEYNAEDLKVTTDQNIETR